MSAHKNKKQKENKSWEMIPNSRQEKETTWEKLSRIVHKSRQPEKSNIIEPPKVVNLTKTKSWRDATPEELITMLSDGNCYSQDCYDDAAKSKHPEVIMALASCDHTPPALLEAIAKQEDSRTAAAARATLARQYIRSRTSIKKEKTATKI